MNPPADYLPDLHQVRQVRRVLDRHGVVVEVVLPGAQHGAVPDGRPPGDSGTAESSAVRCKVKVGLQLYKIAEDSYLLDIRKVDGDVLPFKIFDELQHHPAPAFVFYPYMRPLGSHYGINSGAVLLHIRTQAELEEAVREVVSHEANPASLSRRAVQRERLRRPLPPHVWRWRGAPRRRRGPWRRRAAFVPFGAWARPRRGACRRRPLDLGRS